MTLSLEHFDVRAMVHELVDTVGPLIEKNENALLVHCADAVGTMYADLMKTRQILLNLLGNAAKFTRSGTIALHVGREGTGARPSVVFAVTDTGVGMTPEQTRKNPYARIPADRSTNPQRPISAPAPDETSTTTRDRT